jgi:hypothetical protein
LPEEENGRSFRNVLLSNYLDFRTMDEVQKPGDTKADKFACELGEHVPKLFVMLFRQDVIPKYSTMNTDSSKTKSFKD